MALLSKRQGMPRALLLSEKRGKTSVARVFYIEIDETAGCAGEPVRLERVLAPLKRQAGVGSGWIEIFRID